MIKLLELKMKRIKEKLKKVILYIWKIEDEKK